ncbi:MAG: 23S rRNA (uracil(1939)-C(5))-methyltransferase RlmD [Desulfobacterales bacterium]|nr:23S rRNA (uracil(1939)-C(5))-methyltransferase RlmD [Desulfobacterales bacterium]
MPIKKGQDIELAITDLAFGGRGIAKVDGFTVFVDQAVPEDRVMARIYKRKKSYAEARVVSLISPSPYRIDPPCPYNGWCGGCKWQFLDYEKQLEYKRRHVSESLAHIGGLKDVPIPATRASDRVFHYRNKMEFSCADRRWLLPEEMGDPAIDVSFALGLHVPGTYHKVLDIDRCLLQPETGNLILNDAKRYMKNSGLPAYGLKTHEGFWRFLMLRHSVAYDQWLVNIVTASEALPSVQPLAEALIEKYPGVVSVVNNITARKSGVATGEYEVPLAGEVCLKERIGPFEFEVSANSFFQTNTRGAEILYQTVKRYADLSGVETVLDLYSGTGTIPIWLSDAAKSIIGIEIVSGAVLDAEKNCRYNGVTNCTFLTGDISQRISDLKKSPEVMIIDPPRPGMHKDVVKKVLEIRPARIVYVSCNPATLARDLEMLSENYGVVEVQPVDMFPHTFHIEAVAKLEKR